MYINTKGEPYVPWRVSMYFELNEMERKKELEKYRVENLPPVAAKHICIVSGKYAFQKICLYTTSM